MSDTAPARRLGLIVNPIAGMGGAAGLKSTDGPALARARAKGAAPVAPDRAARALAELAPLRGRLRVIAAPGAMGGDAAREAGLEVETVGDDAPAETDAEHTRRAAAAMAAAGVDLLLFVGG